MDRLQERPHGRRALFVTFVVLMLPAWWWIVAMALDMYGPMTGPSAWMMTTAWDAPRLLLLWVMWAVMMAAMMLPSAWPMMATYSGLARRQAAADRTGTSGFIVGYLVVWAGFSVAATVLQRLLSRLLVLSPMMELVNPTASALTLVVAGAFQFTPLKQRCLRACRTPFSFLLAHWRRGRFGPFRMGLEHGALCVGCCWALMLLLFAGGVMNVYVIVALTTLVLLEKVLPGGETVSRVAGAALILLAVLQLVS